MVIANPLVCKAIVGKKADSGLIQYPIYQSNLLISQMILACQEVFLRYEKFIK
jgi:hypothetical protein